MSQDIRKLINGLKKGGTSQPMRKSKVMKIEPFRELFRSWGDNEWLTLEMLRMKTFTLLVLCVMLRPLDVAPKAQVWNKDQEKWVNLGFTRDKIEFLENGAMSVYFHGTKNDYDRDGAQVFIQPSGEQKLCPVKAMQSYLHRTAKLVKWKEAPVFLALT